MIKPIQINIIRTRYLQLLKKYYSIKVSNELVFDFLRFCCMMEFERNGRNYI